MPSRNAFFLESLQNFPAFFSKFLQTGSWYHSLPVDIKPTEAIQDSLEETVIQADFLWGLGDKMQDNVNEDMQSGAQQTRGFGRLQPQPLVTDPDVLKMGRGRGSFSWGLHGQ